MSLREIREKRMRLATEARQTLDACQAENRSLNTEEQSKLDKLWAEIEECRKTEAAFEKQADLEADLAQPAVERRSGREDRGGPSRDRVENAELERRAFAAWMRGGNEGLNAEQRNVLSPLRRNDPEFRAAAAQSSVNTAGGYTVPSLTRAEVMKAMAAFGGIRRTRAQVITTDGGGPLTFPTNNDSGTTGRLLAENAVSLASDTTFAAVQLDGYIYTSDIILAPYSLLQDSGVDIEAYINGILAERLGRVTETAYASGDGTNKPRGITIGSTASGLTYDISDDALTLAMLMTVEHAVDPAYRQVAEWMMHDTFLAKIQKLSFTSAMPWGIWQPSAREGMPDQILGYPYTVNNSMPTLSGTSRPCVFGDLSYYKIRDVRDVMMMRLTERYADYWQVGFVGFLRTDGDVVDPGTHPIVYVLTQA